MNRTCGLMDDGAHDFTVRIEEVGLRVALAEDYEACETDPVAFANHIQAQRQFRIRDAAPVGRHHGRHQPDRRHPIT